MRLEFVKSLWLLGAAFCMASAAQAVPLASDAPAGTLSLAGSSQVNLTFNLVGSQDLLTRYTIGVFDLNKMSADVDDPDFQVQALQANKVRLLHEAGKPVESSYQLSVDGNARLGMFILRDSSLRDFSLGRNFYRPIFSLPGAPGSHMVEQDEALELGQMIFSFSSPSIGRVFATGDGSNSRGEGFQVYVSGFDVPQIDDPLVPEPTTIGLIGLGLGVMGLRRRWLARA